MHNTALRFRVFYLRSLYQKHHSVQQKNGSDEAYAFKEIGSKIVLRQLKLAPF
jgi:hypothetical protein